MHKFRSRIQGESLQIRISDLEFKIYEVIFFPALFLIITIYLWLATIDLFQFNKITAIVFTIFTLFSIIHSYFKVKKIRKKLKNYRKGLEGERLVGEILNKLANESTYIFHDIPGNQFNVDHIIVSTRGVFVIETKHFDRSNGHEFFFDGNMVYKQTSNKRFLCPKLLPQLDGEAYFIQKEIEQKTELKIPVIKVAVLVGCYIHTPKDVSLEKCFEKYWIVNDKWFVSIFNNLKEIYDDSVVKLIESHIKEWIKIDIDK